MTEPLSSGAWRHADHHGLFGRMLLLSCKTLAVAGGLLFVALVAMSIVSIVGRKLASAPVPGDVEVLQMVAAAASASFFAYCHMNEGDVKVDFFTATASSRTVHLLDALGSFLVGCFGLLLSWRAGAGAAATLSSGETSAILGWPVGMAQMAMLPGFILLALAGWYMSARHVRQALADTEGAAS